MSEWKKVKLGEICSRVTSGGTPKANVESFYAPPTIPWLKTKEVNYSRIYKTENYISEDGLANSSAKLIAPNSVIIAMYGQGDTAGRVAINKIPLTTNQACCNLTFDDKKANYEFVYYQLCTLYDKMVSLKSGAAQPNLNAQIIKGLEISLPSLTTQDYIATILSRYDSLIENYQKQIKLLEEAAQRLYKDWFVDLHFPGHENTKIVNGVPEGWEKKRLEDIFSYVRGRSYTSKELSDSGTILVNLKNIQAFGGYKREAEKRYLGDYKQEQSLEVGDLIMGVTDMTQERRLVGHVALIPEFNGPATFSMDLIKILPFEISKSFLYCAMRFGGISKQIAPLANGVNVLHLKPEAMMGIEMLVPSKGLVKHFDDYYNHGFKTILHLQDQIRLLTEARDRVLPKLMSVEIAV